MYINGSKIPTSVFLNQVHADMINRYTLGGIIGQANIMEQNAQKLEIFFRQLKQDAQKPFDSISSILNQQILEDVQVLSGAGTKISKLFHRTGGIKFEQELSKVIYSILSRVSTGNLNNQVSLADKNKGTINLGNINVGSQRANIAHGLDLEALILNPEVQRILEITGVETVKYFSKEDRLNKNKYRYLTSVEGKTDVQGYTVEINGNPSAELLSIYHLLKDATFSAKNYGSFYWDSKIRGFNVSTHLRLGNTNVFRAFYGVLSELGYRDSTIISAFWGSWYEAEKHPQIALRINQIRFVYELIGSGLSYDNDLLSGRVKYLIYNDPESDEIYVRSTAKIIQQLLQSDQLGYENPFTRAVIIEKNFFHSI